MERSTIIGIVLVILALVLGWLFRNQLAGLVMAATSFIAGHVAILTPGRLFRLIPKPTLPSLPSFPLKEPAMVDASSILSNVVPNIEAAIVNEAATQLGATDLLPEAKKVFSDVLALYSNRSAMNLVTTGIDVATLVHDLLVKVQAYEAQPKAAA